MEDPAREIGRVIQSLTATPDPNIQKDAVERWVRVEWQKNIALILYVLRFYASNVEFRHPLCTVPSGPNSRDSLLGIYQYAITGLTNLTYILR